MHINYTNGSLMRILGKAILPNSTRIKRKVKHFKLKTINFEAKEFEGSYAD